MGRWLQDVQSTRRTGAVFHVSKGSAQGLRHACSGSGLEREALGRAAYRPDPAKTVAAFNSRRRKVYAPGCVNRATAIVGGEPLLEDGGHELLRVCARRRGVWNGSPPGMLNATAAV